MIDIPHSITDFQWLVIVFFGTVIIYFLKKKDKVIEDHEKALRENTFALMKLSMQMENALRELTKLPTMEKDLNNLGEKVRNLSQ